MNKAKKTAKKYVQQQLESTGDSVVVRIGDIVSISQDGKIEVIPRELADDTSITRLNQFYEN